MSWTALTGTKYSFNFLGLGSGNAMFTVTGSVTSVAPSQGSANGCNQITISGLGRLS